MRNVLILTRGYSIIFDIFSKKDLQFLVLNSKRYMWKALKRWWRSILLWIGIIFTVLSVYVTHSIVGERNQKLLNMQKTLNESQKQMDKLWQDQMAIENRSAITYLLLTSGNEKLAKDFINDTLERFSISEEDEKKLSKIDIIRKYTKAKQQDTIDAIDMIYINNFQTEADLDKLKQEYDSVKAVALFLQVMGLVFVLYAGSDV